MKRAAAAVVFSLLACREPTRAPVAAPAAKTLKVSLPVEFSADPIAAGLEIRHHTQVVGTLELKPAPKPTADAMEDLLKKSGASSIHKESEGLYFGFTYTLTADAGTRRAFLGINSSSGPGVGCASTATISPDEIEAFAGICRSVTLVTVD